MVPDSGCLPAWLLTSPVVRRSPRKAQMDFSRYAIERDSPAVLTPSPPARAPRAGRSPLWPATKAQTRCPPLARRLPRTRSGFFFNDTATTEIYTLSLHDALPI